MSQLLFGFTLNLIIDFLTPDVFYFEVSSMHESQLIVEAKKKLIRFVFQKAVTPEKKIVKI